MIDDLGIPSIIEDRIEKGALIFLIIILSPFLLIMSPLVGIFYLFGWIHDKFVGE